MSIAAIIIAIASAGLSLWTRRNQRRTDHVQHKIAVNQLNMAKLMRDRRL